jgi:hypothetical protein
MNQRFHALQELGDQFEHAIASAPSRTARARFPLTGRKLWAAIGASGSAITAGIVATVLILSSSASIAYAGWSPVPTAATPSAIAAASNVCANGFTGTGAAANHQAFSQQPVLAETRDISTALIEVSNGKLYSCVTGQNPQQPSPAIKITDFGAVSEAPGTEQITAPYQLQSGVGAGYIGPFVPAPPANAPQAQILNVLAQRELHGFGLNAVGQAGSDVSAVSFTFANGETVSATLQNGWYFAWWPWIDEPTSVTVTTSSGTLNSPVTGQGGITRKSIVPGCQPDTAGCVFASPTSTSAGTTNPPSTDGSHTTSTATTTTGAP